MSNKPVVKLPKALADAFDTYFQTSKFAQKNFIRFNKEMLLKILEKAAARYNYTIDHTAFEPGFKGIFKLSRATRAIRVSAATMPMAEVWREGRTE